MFRSALNLFLLGVFITGANCSGSDGANSDAGLPQQDGGMTSDASPVDGPPANDMDAAMGRDAGASLSFFVTSQGNGFNGGDLGGLVGADARCQALAEAVGAGDRVWRAYLSTDDIGIGPVVSARDRIGSGPWFNAKGDMVASDIDSLHENGLDPSLMVDELGGAIPADESGVMTGSRADGTVKRYLDVDILRVTTCQNWTSSNLDVFSGLGRADDSAAKWNEAYVARCNLEVLNATNSSGRFMCFATD